MKNILLGFFFLFSFTAHSQVSDTLPWAPKGATWLYVGKFIGGEAFGKFTYTTDTIVLGRIAKKIVYSQFEIWKPYPYQEFRTKEYFVRDYFYCYSHDSVFWFNKTQFDLLFVFDTNIGKQWIVPSNKYYNITSDRKACFDTQKPDSNYFKVVSVAQRFYSKKQFDILFSDYQPYWDIGSQIIKNIGTLSAPLYPLVGRKCSFIDEDMGVPSELIFYCDDVRGCLNIARLGDCLGFFAGVNDINSKTLQILRISPNPVQNTLHIEDNLNNAIKSFKIYDVMGHEFISISNYSNTDINMAQLPNGIYILKALTVENNFLSNKFIKVN